MKQETDRLSDADFREPLRQASLDRRGEPDLRKRKARSAALNTPLSAPPTFTSQMLEYRSWWNLPGPKARKTHS